MQRLMATSQFVPRYRQIAGETLWVRCFEIILNSSTGRRPSPLRACIAMKLCGLRPGKQKPLPVFAGRGRKLQTELEFVDHVKRQQMLVVAIAGPEVISTIGIEVMIPTILHAGNDILPE